MEKVNKPVKRKTVQEVFNQYIQELESANRLRYADMYKDQNPVTVKLFQFQEFFFFFLIRFLTQKTGS